MGRVRQWPLLVLLGSSAFIAVLLYRRPAGLDPNVLRAMHEAIRAQPEHEAAAPVGGALHTHFMPASGTPLGGETSANPFAPDPAAAGQTAPAARGLGNGIESLSSGSSAGAGSVTDQSGSGDGAAGAGALATGVTPAQAENQLAKVAHGLSEANGGVRVDQVSPSSVVGKLGLQTGDIIVSVNGEPISSPEQFARIYEKDGSPRQIQALRGGQLVLANP